MKSFLRALPKKWICALVAITMLSSCANELKLVKINNEDPVYVKKHDLKKSTENVVAAVSDAKLTNEVTLANMTTELTNKAQLTETPDASSAVFVSTQTTPSVSSETKTMCQLVKEKMAENAVISALPAKAQQKMENFVVKRVAKIEAKHKAKAAAAAPAIINREFTIGLIILLAGILLTAVVDGTLGGIVSVVGVVLMVIGLIHGV
ncbi:hypothetical protein [Solitalea koreensis]|uniref:Uncharacterized protein n=1 Tax=Solitalea koreensis TaxID=543615 RepID=A0A521BYN3_9SPHI|nr:hypothetical protein [Solitalea koreensis]SMO52308.1 hypothetical protein SAMN06265350_10353 [Solitalea koreensis]